MTVRTGMFSLIVATGFGAAFGGPQSTTASGLFTAQVLQQSPPGAVGAQTAAGLAALVFQGVTVVDVQTGRLRPSQTVVITGTRITAMGPVGQVAVPAGARVVNARGQYLIPGLWDMHNHIGAWTLPAEQSAVMRNEHVLLLANGITGMRDAGTSVPLDSLLVWRRAILAGTRVGPPRQLLAGRSLEENHESTGSTQTTTQWTHLLLVSTLAEARHAVDSLLAAGADYIKVHDFSEALRDSVVAELRQRGVLFGGHLDTMHVGARFIDHGFGNLNLDCRSEEATLARCQRLAAWMRRRDMWFVANPLQLGGGHVALSRAWEGLPSREQARLLPGLLDMALEGFPVWSGAPRSLATASGPSLRIPDRADIPLLVGTDNGVHGFGSITGPPSQWFASARLHDGMAGLVQRGMSPLTVLRAATLNPARALHVTDSLGTVAVGKLADLVLLAGNPLADIRNTTTIQGVVANGRYFDRAALDSLLAGVDYKLEFHLHSQPTTATP